MCALIDRGTKSMARRQTQNTNLGQSHDSRAVTASGLEHDEGLPGLRGGETCRAK